MGKRFWINLTTSGNRESDLNVFINVLRAELTIIDYKDRRVGNSGVQVTRYFAYSIGTITLKTS